MKHVRYLSDVHRPAFLAGKKDERRELEDAHANTLIRAGYVALVANAAAPESESETIKPVSGSEVTAPPSEATE